MRGSAGGDRPGARARVSSLADRASWPAPSQLLFRSTHAAGNPTAGGTASGSRWPCRGGAQGRGGSGPALLERLLVARADTPKTMIRLRHGRGRHTCA
jgi:hypothetical protein